MIHHSSHQPVLLHEIIKFLDPKPGEFIIDGTIDGGGHAAEVISIISPGGKLLGIEWDKKMFANCVERMADKKNLILVNGNYVDLPEILKKEKLGKADGLLLDLGFSSEQLENSDKGFSFMKDEPLLMTYDDNRKPIKQLIKELNVKELAKIIFDYSGEKFAMRIAETIKEKQKIKPIETTGELKEAVYKSVPRNYERGRIDPATRTFQALRIYANDELGNLEKVLKNLPAVLKSGGRVAIISFHSLEDGLVKQNFRAGEAAGWLKILNKKPVAPSEEEVSGNPRSRSAKLRAAQLI